MVGMSTVGRFIEFLSGIQDGLTGANSGALLRAIGDLLDGVALAFVK